MANFLNLAGGELRDLSIRDCGDISMREAARVFLGSLTTGCPKLERFDARNTIVPMFREVEEAVLLLAAKRSNLLTLNLGSISLDASPFIRDLARAYPEEGVDAPKVLL